MSLTQPITKKPKFLEQLMSNSYNFYMVNNNNIQEDAVFEDDGTKERKLTL